MSACIENGLLEQLPVRFVYYRHDRKSVRTIAEANAWYADPKNRLNFGVGDWVLWRGEVARIVEIRPSLASGVTLELIDSRFGRCDRYRIDVQGYQLTEHQHPVQVLVDGTIEKLP